MDRRSLLSSIGVALLSFKAYGAKLVGHSSAEAESASNELKQQMTLQAGSVFLLPEKPADGTTITFIPVGDLEKKPAVIKASGQAIMSEKEDLEVDLSASFTLYYNEKYKSWGLV